MKHFVLALIMLTAFATTAFATMAPKESRQEIIQDIIYVPEPLTIFNSSAVKQAKSKILGKPNNIAALKVGDSRMSEYVFVLNGPFVFMSRWIENEEFKTISTDYDRNGLYFVYIEAPSMTLTRAAVYHESDMINPDYVFCIEKHVEGFAVQNAAGLYGVITDYDSLVRMPITAFSYDDGYDQEFHDYIQNSWVTYKNPSSPNTHE